MKIAKLATAVVEANFHWTHVRVYTDDAAGLPGTRECFFAPGRRHRSPGSAWSDVTLGERLP